MGTRRQDGGDRGRGTRRVPSFVLAAAAAFLALPLACGDTLDRRAVASRSLYDRHCGRCHGLSDDGHVPVAGLGFESTDLRRLSERYGTPLDRERLAAYIDGRHGLAEDETRPMPVWGEKLYDHLPESVQIDEMRAGTIGLLIEYLEKIQSRS